ncbi:hypothetical protein F4561_005332 [Lipingzhangella halophila]|uniref:DUF4267 domain-containing protein n=1 Tax=Lipingzhangella halophila TaxID=1783352 RepID=A0A7W7W4T4_9ACTN|nr:hypothetical protein [Lipingzhangella halophila]MBB4934512.1 hypothetical protein [Lipingzhangella halophila]
MALLARALGLGTAVFGAATIVRPEIVAVPTGLAEGDGSVSRETRVLTSLIGFRDVAVGTGMALAPRGPALRWLIAARVASDAGDAVFLGRGLASAPRRTGAVLVAGGWAALCALSAKGAGRREAAAPATPART